MSMELLVVSAYCQTDRTEWKEHDRGADPLSRMVRAADRGQGERCDSGAVLLHYVLLIFIITEPYTQTLEPY